MLHHVLTVEELTGDDAGVVQFCFYVSTLLIDNTCRNVTTAAWDLDVWEDAATLQVAPAGSAWKGDLDLLALYNGVLTDVQIQQNFHEGAANAIPTTQSLNATIVPGYINNVSFPPATDPEGEELTFIITSLPQHGTLHQAYGDQTQVTVYPAAVVGGAFGYATTDVLAASDEVRMQVMDAHGLLSGEVTVTLDLIPLPPVVVDTVTPAEHYVYTRVCVTALTSRTIIGVTVLSLPRNGTLHPLSADIHPLRELDIEAALTPANLPYSWVNASREQCFAYRSDLGIDELQLTVDAPNVLVDSFQVNVTDSYNQTSSNTGTLSLNVTFAVNATTNTLVQTRDEFTSSTWRPVLTDTFALTYTRTAYTPPETTNPVFYLNDTHATGGTTYSYEIHVLPTRGRLQLANGLILIPFMLPYAIASLSEVFYRPEEHDNSCKVTGLDDGVYDTFAMRAVSSDGFYSAVTTLSMVVTPVSSNPDVDTSRSVGQGARVVSGFYPDTDSRFINRLYFNVSDLDTCVNVRDDIVVYFQVVTEPEGGSFFLQSLVRCDTDSFNFTSNGADLGFDGTKNGGRGRIPWRQLQGFLDSCEVAYTVNDTNYTNSLRIIDRLGPDFPSGDPAANKWTDYEGYIDEAYVLPFDPDDSIFYPLASSGSSDIVVTFELVLYITFGVVVLMACCIAIFAGYTTYMGQKGMEADSGGGDSSSSSQSNNGPQVVYRERDGGSGEPGWNTEALKKCGRTFGRVCVFLFCMPAYIAYKCCGACGGCCYRYWCGFCGADMDVAYGDETEMAPLPLYR